MPDQRMKPAARPRGHLRPPARRPTRGLTHGAEAYSGRRLRERPRRILRAMTAELPATTRLRLVGADVEVPLVTGGMRRYVNLDFAASAPPLTQVATAVDEMA